MVNIFGIAFQLLVSQSSPNEMVMRPGMSISATTASGTMVIKAIDRFTRAYAWEGATRSVELIPRSQRWYGSMGAFYPGPGDHWKEHHGITRGVLEEGQQHFKTVSEALKWIKDRNWQPNAYRNDGLFVGWGKVLERRQLDVEVFQLYVNGKKPLKLPGSHDFAITVSTGNAPSAKSSIVDAVQLNDLPSVTALLNKGANPNAKNVAGSPILAVASSRGQTAIVAALLQAGANPNVRTADANGETPLLLATNKEVIKLLLRKGAHPDAAPLGGMTQGDTKLILAALVGDSATTDLLLKAGANPRAAGADGATALHWAARNGNLAMARSLIARGAMIDARDGLGMTPLLDSVGFQIPTPREKIFAMVKLLVSHGANVNARSDKTRQRYAAARFTDDKATVQQIERSGKLNHLAEDGPSALELTDDDGIKKLLRSAGAKG